MYQLEKGNRNIKIKASASYMLMEKMCFEVEKFSKEIKFENRRFALMICVREALTNAIRHGSKNDDSKTVYMEVNYDRNGLQFTITDEGEGFDWKIVKNTKSSQLNTFGRGRDIMKIYSDEFHYNEIGNQIKILIRNE